MDAVAHVAGNQRPTQKKPITTNAIAINKKKKTPTALLCELTRLKSQQKYLECTQVKLLPEQFIDVETQQIAPPIVALINEIDVLKQRHSVELLDYTRNARREVQDLWVFVDAIHDDVFEPQRLRQFTVRAICDRIIGINKHLERLQKKNAIALNRLQDEFVELASKSNNNISNCFV